MPLPTLLLGIGGLFGFHFLLFLALRYAPPVEANLVNYLWPLLIVLLTPLLLPGWRLAPRHVVGRGAGIRGRGTGHRRRAGNFTPTTMLGFAFAAGSALVWACYSLLTRRVRAFFVVGGRRIRAGFRSASRCRCISLFEAPAHAARRRSLGLLVLLGLGPMGLAFYLWDFAMKRGDPRVIGVLAYATPLLSTALLVAVTGRPLTPSLALATLLVVAAAISRAGRRARDLSGRARAKLVKWSDQSPGPRLFELGTRRFVSCPSLENDPRARPHSAFRCADDRRRGGVLLDHRRHHQVAGRALSGSAHRLGALGIPGAGDGDVARAEDG